MPLTVLTDANVRDLLDGLSLPDVHDLQSSLQQALHDYSTGTQDIGACATNQPERTSLHSPNGTTTLFMPSTSSAGIGIKVVTLGSPESADSASAATDTSPRGAITIMASTGQPTGFINAEEVTAFRTALVSSVLLVRRSQLKTITVFGAGKQAFWHIRLALLLRGSTIRTVNVVNRSFSDRARDMMKTFFGIDSKIKEHEGWANTKFSMLSPGYVEYPRLLKEQIRHADVIITTVPSTSPLFDHTILTSHEGRKKGRLILAIGSYKSHMIEIPKEILLQAVKPSHDGRHFHKHASEGGVVVVDSLTGCLKEAGEIIQAGLSPLQLVEVGELVMLEVQAPIFEEADNSSESLDMEKLKLQLREVSSSSESSIATVFKDDYTGTTGSGSNSPSRLSRKSSRSEKHRRSSSTDSRKGSSKEDGMSRWLSTGNVVYKSVGMGLMDLVVGADLVRLAREKGIGTTIPNF